MKAIKSIGDIRKLKKKHEKKLLRQKKQEERRKEFRESIKSDFNKSKFVNFINAKYDKDCEKQKKIRKRNKEVDEFTMYKKQKILGLEANSYADVDLGETTLQKLEKEFFRKDLIIWSLAILIFCSIAYGIYITNSSADVKKQVEILTEKEKEQDFETQLLEFTYKRQEEMFKFLKKNDVKEDFIDNNGVKQMLFILRNKQYEINIIDEMQRIEFRVYEIKP